MKWFVLIAIILFSVTTRSFSQSESVKKNNINVEALGLAGVYSFNYERHFTLTEVLGLNLGIGIGPSIQDISRLTRTKFTRIPFRANLSFRRNKNRLITGFNILYYENVKPREKIDLDNFQGAWYYNFGYRHSYNKNRLFVGVNAYLYFFDQGSWKCIPWGGVQFGFKF